MWKFELVCDISFMSHRRSAHCRFVSQPTTLALAFSTTLLHLVVVQFHSDAESTSHPTTSPPDAPLCCGLHRSFTMLRLARLVGRSGTAASACRSHTAASQAFHTSHAVRCGLLSVLQQSGPFSPVSTAVITRWQDEREAVKRGVQRGLEAIKHRGPDGSAVWMSEDSGVALGHTRLAIMDLTPTGSAPFHHWRTNTHVAVNGEIYGWRELRKEAEAAGFELTSSCDSEMALYLYHKHGIQASRHIARSAQLLCSL